MFFLLSTKSTFKSKFHGKSANGVNFHQKAWLKTIKFRGFGFLFVFCQSLKKLFPVVSKENVSDSHSGEFFYQMTISH